VTFPFPGPGERAPRRPTPPATPSRARRVLIPTAIILIVLVALIGAFADFYTDLLWYRSLEASKVFTTRLFTEALLFVVCGLVVAAIIVGNIVIAFRTRPSYHGASLEQQSLDRYRDVLTPRRRLITIVLAILTFIFTGMASAGNWKTYLLWRHGHSFGIDDPQFHKDVGFYSFDLPFYRWVLTLLFAAVAFGLIAAAVTHYLYGGIRLQTPGDKTTPAAQVHLSVLLGVFLLLKAVAYWLDRYELTLAEHERFTGASYTDVKAILPGKMIMMIIALICAILFFASIFRRTWLLPGVGLGLMILSTILVGGIYPAIIQQIQVRPSEAEVESPYIKRNIDASREAYGFADLVPTEYNASTETSPQQLRDDAASVPGIRLLDPTVVSPTFEQLQQVRGFYSFPDALDVDRYDVNGQERDTVIAVREIDIDGIPTASKNWLNEVTAYTHGFGVVAAYGNQRSPDGNPVFSVEDIPPVSALGDFEPRVYFGQHSPPYSIVAAPEGTPPVEFDIPEGGEAGEAIRNTYDGKGGVPIGSMFNQLLYSIKFQQTSILLSNRVNSESKILYDRDPRLRVQRVAPWLSVDGDPYPAIVDGRIVWVLDGYTTVDGYPYSQRTELDSATSDSTTVTTRSVVAQAQEQINYIRNSVKATVDAYDGNVTLYAWDESDPVLKTWMDVFPGMVKPRADISDGLLAHLRYPEDMFKVQREMIAKYHVTDPQVVYSGQELWQIPDDPTATGAAQPPYYLSIRLPGQDAPSFSLTTSYVPNNRANLAAFMAVDAEARSPDYGTFRILELPGNTQISGPQQVANTFESDPDVARELSLLRAGDASVVLGNLLTLPVGGGLLYVQPVYVERQSGTATYPLLQRVLVSFGGSEKIGFASSLTDALNQVFSGEGEPPPTGEPTEPPPTGEPTTPPVDQTLAEAIADAQAAYDRAQAALRDGDFAAYGEALQDLEEALNRAEQLSGVTPTITPTTPAP
jgi:uncharacterized membrane protein (UPF0182 family)